MFVVCLIFASLGICGSTFIAVMFVLNQKEIDKKAVDDAEKLLAIQHMSHERHPPSGS